jgi:tetratricopeptide (TPR) repeat protein
LFPGRLAQELSGWIAELDYTSARHPRRPLWVIAETAPQCRFTLENLTTLHALAIERSVVILMEFHESQATSAPSGIRVARIRPFSLRECVIASSHLQDNPSLSAVNGRALRVAAGGNPWLVRQYLRTWLAGNRSDREVEPVNFDRLDSVAVEFWNRRFADLPKKVQTILGRASVFHHSIPPGWLADPYDSHTSMARQFDDLADRGWVERISASAEPLKYSFVCRSARNFVRQKMGVERLRTWAIEILSRAGHAEPETALSLHDYWELHRLARHSPGRPSVNDLWGERRGVIDIKLATYALLQEYRHARAEPSERLSSMASDISDGFAALGGVRRQKRWAAVAFEHMRSQQTEAGMSLTTARSLCHLHDLSGDLPEKKTALVALLGANEAVDNHVRGFLLSELSAAHLLLSDFKKANSCCFEAYHLLEDVAPESEEYVRNLNRLGLSLMRIGRFAAARKHLERCRKMAQESGLDHISRRSLGNLVLLERALGNPQAAMRCSRRVLQGYRSAQEHLTYLMALPDKVMCFVDLGLCYPAMRTAELAVRLSNLYSDPVQFGWALNNLGWVSTMQGEVAGAQAHLEGAIRSRLRIGDLLWVARSRLNIAWNLLLVHDLEGAERSCRSALSEIGRQNDLHGQCEALRILAQAAILRRDLVGAESHLSDIPVDDPRLSPRDKVETSLAWLNLHLWMKQESRARRILEGLADDPIVRNVHPLRCDFGRLRGHWHMLNSEYDKALDILGSTAIDCRQGGRFDKLLDTIIVLALLAGRMSNWTVGLRYLRTVRKMIDSMRGQLR